MVKEGYVLLITIAVMLRKYAVTPIFRCETQCSTIKLTCYANALGKDLHSE